MWCVVQLLLPCLRSRRRIRSNDAWNDLETDPSATTNQAAIEPGSSPSLYHQRHNRNTKLESDPFASPDPPTQYEQQQVQKIVRALPLSLLTLPRTPPLVHRRLSSSTVPTKTGSYHRRALLANSALHSSASHVPYLPFSRRASSHSVTVATLTTGKEETTTVMGGATVDQGVVIPVRPLPLGSRLPLVTDPGIRRTRRTRPNSIRSMSKPSASSSYSGSKQHDSSLIVRRSSEPIETQSGSTTTATSHLSPPRPFPRARSSTSPNMAPRLSTILAGSTKEFPYLVRERTWVE